MSDLKRELKDAVESWVDREFNYVQISAVNECLEHDGQYLQDYIEPLDIDDYINEWWEYGADDDLKQEILNELIDSNITDSELPDYLKDNYESEIQEWVDENKADDNYPMWNTLFEFRSEPPAEWVEKAKRAGFGVINQTDDFNTMLFVSGCGYSFYSAHWIPLWLAIFGEYNSKFKDITKKDYEDL